MPGWTGPQRVDISFAPERPRMRHPYASTGPRWMQEGGYYMGWMRLVTSLFFTFLAAPALASQDLYTGHSLTGG
jgi:hypothetical protein